MDDKFLAQIITDAARIKVEPEEIDELPIPINITNQPSEITPFEPPEPPRFPYARNVPTDYFHTRAKAIQLRNTTNQNSSFYANVPRNRLTSIPQSNVSPLMVSGFNSHYGFQATTENFKKVAIDANPHNHIPLEVQQASRRMGADFEKFSRDPRLRNKIHISEPAKKVDEATTSTLIPPVDTTPKTPTVIRKDSETQTSDNDSYLRFELSFQEMEDLPEEKKKILLEFMTTFKIPLGRAISDLEERLKHRRSIRFINNTTKHSNDSRDDRNKRRYDSPSPTPKQPRLHYNPPT